MSLNRGRNAMLTTTEVANLLHVHTNTVRRWSDLGILKAYRICSRGDRRFYRADIARHFIKTTVEIGNHTKIKNDNTVRS